MVKKWHYGFMRALLIDLGTGLLSMLGIDDEAQLGAHRLLLTILGFIKIQIEKLEKT